MKTRLSKIDPQLAINQLNQSIENGWKGIFEIKEGTGKIDYVKAAMDNINSGANKKLNDYDI